MKKREIRYSPFTPKEIDIYKRETSPLTQRKADMTNIALIKIRKNFLDNFNRSANLTGKIGNYNKVIRTKDVTYLVKLIRSYLNEK